MAKKLTPIEMDAIGEVMNISMGAAATAVSSMLDRQVVITTPYVEIQNVSNINYRELEPALLVKIVYTEGITGSNVMVFSQRDMQLILNQLMGIDEPPSEDFVFDELSMSAACEIMNQMMGSSATALSNFLGYSINISTPTAEVMTTKDVFTDAIGLTADTDIVSITFNIKIGNIMDSQFINVMSCDLAKEITTSFLQEPQEPDEIKAPENPGEAPSQQVPEQPAPAMPQQNMEEQMQQQQMMGQQMPPQMQQQPMMGQQMPPQMQQPMMSQQMPPQMQQPMMSQQMPPQMQQPMMSQQMPPQMDPQMQGYYPPYPPNPYYPYPPQYAGMPPMQPQMQEKHPTVMNAQFADFSNSVPQGAPILNENMGLIMNVPLSVTVEIGSAKRKIKEILDFNQGTVIELNKQAGSPVDIIVNGQLFARGDVVVLDDNFGVRITEILGTKELLDSLEKAPR